MVTETYPPEINGVAFTLARWVEGLRRRGHRVQLIRVRQRPLAVPLPNVSPKEDLEFPGFRIPGYPELQAGWPAGRALLTQWRESPPDVVHIATEGPLGYSALRAARHLGIPISTSFHTNFQQYSRHYRIGWLAKPITAYLRHFHNQALQILVPTDGLARELRTLGFQRLQVLARGVDTILFNPERRDSALREQWGVTPQAPAVLCVGRLAAEKNLQLAITAFQAIHRICPDARLILVGDGPMMARLRSRYPDFVYCGMRQGEDLAAHYASADMFLFPSLTETFGNVVLEAIASGLPVVAFDYAAAHTHIEPNRCGLVVPFGDTDAFIAAATALVQDRAMLATMSQSARQASLGIDSERLYDRLEALLASVIIKGENPCPNAFRTT